MTYLYEMSNSFEAQETDNRINGLGNVLPYLVLRDGAPRDIEGTLYIRDSLGGVYSNKWSNPAMVGDEWRWYAGNSRQGHSLPVAVGYYLWRKDAYAWQVLGSDWQEASNTLIKLGLAKAYVAPTVSIEDAVTERVKQALKKRPNRGVIDSTRY